MSDNFKQLLVIALGFTIGIAIAVTLAPKAKASGCYSEVKYPATQNETVSGRSVLVVTPENYDSTLRGNLVIQFHGYGMNPTWMRQLSGSLERYAGDNSIFFYPATEGPAWDQNTNGRDVRFFDEMLRFAKDRYCIGKVYVTGYSNGAFFVNWLASQRRNQITAVASVAGGGSYWTSIPAVVIHGYQDSFVSFTLGNATRQNYESRNVCSGKWEQVMAWCQKAIGCKQGDVVWCPWDGNHDWPWFASEQIWNVFKRY